MDILILSLVFLQNPGQGQIFTYIYVIHRTSILQPKQQSFRSIFAQILVEKRWNSMLLHIREI